ncbi:hypothetical protein [Mycolicibacter minnesotensis]
MSADRPSSGAGPGVNLALATWVSVICFWAGTLIGPLSTRYASQLSHSSNREALLVATPILVGALGRIATGLMTDRFGGRTMFIGVSVASILPVLAVWYAAKIGSYPLMLISVFKPPADIWSGLTFLPLAVALGIGTGGVFAWVSHRAPAGSVGSVTGIVAAVGGLGGYFPPLVMGATYDPVRNSYAVGLLLLVATAVILFGYTAIFLRAQEPIAS